MTLPGKSPTFSVTTNSKGHLSGRKWPQVAAGASDRPNLPMTVSDRKWPQRASGRKWPQVAAEGKWPQVTASGRRGQVAASGRRGQVAASGRKWPQRASGREWPQVAAFGKWPRVAASGRLFQFQIPHLMQPLCVIFIGRFCPSHLVGLGQIVAAVMSILVASPVLSNRLRLVKMACNLLLIIDNPSQMLSNSVIFYIFYIPGIFYPLFFWCLPSLLPVQSPERTANRTVLRPTLELERWLQRWRLGAAKLVGWFLVDFTSLKRNHVKKI